MNEQYLCVILTHSVATTRWNALHIFRTKLMFLITITLYSYIACIFRVARACPVSIDMKLICIQIKRENFMIMMSTAVAESTKYHPRIANNYRAQSLVLLKCYQIWRAPFEFLFFFLSYVFILYHAAHFRCSVLVMLHQRRLWSLEMLTVNSLSYVFSLYNKSSINSLDII